MNKRHVVIDADSTIYANCYSQQSTDYCVATYLPNPSRTKRFPSKTAFNDWLKENPKWNKDDFSTENVYNLQNTLNQSIGLATAGVQSSINKIIKETQATSYTVILEGEGNFRKHYPAKWVSYKGQRLERPMIFSQVVERVKEVYRKQGVLIEAVGIETDDLVCMAGWRAHHDPCGSELVIAYKDKDIPANTVGTMYNYQSYSLHENTLEEQRKRFAIQLLIGDTADNIPNLKLTSDIREKYSIRKNITGVGASTAEKLLTDVETCNMLPHILSIYQEVYGKEEGWERMNETGFFLYLLNYPDDKWDLNLLIEKWKN